MLCSSCQSASGRSNTCSFSFSMRSQLRQAVAPFHQGRGDQADDEGRDRAHRATIRTAATARGMRRRSRKLAAGDSMVPTTKAVTTGRKNALAT